MIYILSWTTKKHQKTLFSPLILKLKKTQPIRHQPNQRLYYSAYHRKPKIKNSSITQCLEESSNKAPLHATQLDIALANHVLRTQPKD